MMPRTDFPLPTTTLLLVCVVFLALTAGLEPPARLVPLCVLIPLFVLLAARLTLDLRTRPDTRTKEREDGREATRNEAERAAVGWVVGFGLSIGALGLPAGTGLFVLGYLRRRSHERWAVAVAGGTLTAIALWLILAYGLDAPASAGVLGALLTGRAG